MVMTQSATSFVPRHGLASTLTTLFTNSVMPAVQQPHCLTLIAQKYNQVSLEELQNRYREVLRQGTSNAFVDGKPSHAYRKERFAATLNHISLDHELIGHLLDEYERILVENLKLKPGAESLLQTIKNSGRKIVVITEGPQDAQERAIRDLGIEKFVDFLATTNFFGASKTSGLFGRVLDHLNISPDEISYVGDNMERDIVPARAAGVYAIHFDERQSPDLILDPPSIKSLTVLEKLLPVPNTTANGAEVAENPAGRSEAEETQNLG